MNNKVKTNTNKGSIASVQHKRKVRLLLWGGAYKTNDNFTFESAALSVYADYKNTDRSKYALINKKIDSAEEFVAAINNQETNSIRSVDLFTHGGPDSFYMVSVRSNTDGGLNNFALYRYAFHDESFTRNDLKKIQFDKFSEDAKVELHGCQTAANPDDGNNIAADFSKHLFDAGKKKSVVIGHTTKASPSINGSGGKSSVQDYRFQERAIFRNGRLLHKTLKKGALDENWLSK